MPKFLNVRVDQIIESRWQPREGVGDPAAFEELVANVKAHGIKAALKGFVNEEGVYELITGHRHRRAAIKAGLTHVPLIVVDTPDEAGLRALRGEVFFDSLLHEPLTPLEEARAFKVLQEEEGYSIRQLAERLGKSKSYINERLSLLDKPEDVQELVSAHADTLRHPREIAKVEDPGRRAEIIEKAIDRFLSVPVDQIVASRWQPREDVGDPVAFEELVANIKVHGVKAPLKAFINREGAYELIAGHRRWRAAAASGLTHVPLIVVGVVPRSEGALRALREEVLFDNLLHEPLTPLEEAQAFKALQEEEGYSIRQIAERLGKDRGYIENRLHLLAIPDDVQSLVSVRTDTLRHAREIAKIEDPERRAEIIEEARAGASYQEIKARVDEIIPTKAHTRRPLSPPDEDKEPTLPEPPEEEPCLEPAEEIAEERFIPVNGNGKTVYISIPSQLEESIPEPGPSREIEERIQQVTWKHANPAIGAPTVAGQHCPHCGDSRGREICNVCGHNRWIIAFSSIEDYQRALALIGGLARR